VKPGFYQRFARFYFAADAFTEASLRAERYQCRVGTLSIALFEGCLQRPQLIGVHLIASLPRNLVKQYRLGETLQRNLTVLSERKQLADTQVADNLCRQDLLGLRASANAGRQVDGRPEKRVAVRHWLTCTQTYAYLDRRCALRTVESPKRLLNGDGTFNGIEDGREAAQKSVARVIYLPPLMLSQCLSDDSLMLAQQLECHIITEPVGDVR
jgi:hypothetical protein